MNVTQRLIIAALVCASTLTLAARAQDVVPAKWAPENAVAYVGIADTTKLVEQFKQTAYYRMTQDPDAKDLSGQMSLPIKMFDQFKKHLALALDTQPERLKNPFGGPLAVFFAFPQDESAEEFPGAFVAGVADMSLMRDYYDKATGKFREIADNHEKVSFRSFTIDYFTSEEKEGKEKNPDDEDESFDPNQMNFDESGPNNDQIAKIFDKIIGAAFSGESMPRKLAMCLTDDRLIVGSTPDDIKGVLRRERSGPSLADTETYKTMLREFKPLGGMRFLVNLSALFDHMEAADDEVHAALKLLGARGAKAVIGHALYDNDKFESKMEALLLISGERTGLLKIFSMENGPVKPPASVSADSFMYAGMNADAPAIVDEIERMVRMDDPEEADRMHAALESVTLGEDVTLNLRSELLAKLRPPFTFRMGFERPYGPRSIRILMTLGHRDKDALVRLIGKLSDAWGGMLVDREMQGNVVYDAAYGGMSFAVSDGALLVGTTPAVETVLRTPAPDDSLANSPGFRAAAALAPKEAWAVMYVDSRKMYQAALDMVNKKDELSAAQYTNFGDMLALQVVNSLTAGIEEGNLDAARRLSKYQTSMIMTVATTPEGLRMTQIQLKPDGK